MNTVVLYINFYVDTVAVFDNFFMNIVVWDNFSISTVALEN
jgi:hypothetical protein